MDWALITYPVAMAICFYQALTRKVVGLPVYACALAFMGALSATLEFRGHDLAALIVALGYVALFIRSQITMVRYSL